MSAVIFRNDRVEKHFQQTHFSFDLGDKYLISIFDFILQIKFMKPYLIAISFILFSFVFGQNDVKWGKFSEDEINLTSVSFEPDAGAVVLFEDGNYTITNYGYEITSYFRIKILNQSGYKYAEINENYYSNASNDLKLTKAQTINFENGKPVISKVTNRDIIIENTDKNDSRKKALKVAFPNVKAGSIIEYELKYKSSSGGYNTPWRFQNEIPTLRSGVKIKNQSYGNFKVIRFGNSLMAKYGKSTGRTEWELNNLPSFNSYKNIYNPKDFADQILVQFFATNLQYETLLASNNWDDFKRILKKDNDENTKGVKFNELAGKIKNGQTELETIRNCLKFVQENYKWNDYYYSTYYFKKSLIENNVGNSADLNLMLFNILKSKNIDVELVLNSSRRNGKLILEFPAISRIMTTQNLIKLKSGEVFLIDAALSDPDDIKFLNRNMYNQYVFSLNQPGTAFQKVEPPVSEFQIINQIALKDDNSIVKNKFQYNGYFKDNLPELQHIIGHINFSDNKNKIQTEDGWKTITESSQHQTKNLNLTELKCPFSNFLNDLIIEEDRDYNIEIDFPYFLVAQTIVNSGDENILYNPDFNQETTAFNGLLTYKQSIEIKDNTTIIKWMLLFNKSLFLPEELNDLKIFLSSFKTNSNRSVILKTL